MYSKLAALYVSVAVLMNAAPAFSGWVKVTDLPVARSLGIAEVVNGKIYTGAGAVSGGSNNGRWDSYDPNTDTWTSLPEVGDYYGRASAVSGGKIYAFGGGWNTGGRYQVRTFLTPTQEHGLR